ncbi:hypothetical protein [Peribacillus sp. NPDC097225]|uniref:hypothetical protein n=1 Tax=Peribacillus sp. NPDC097225 TaxID=3364400 RepID=UPI0038009802
MISASTWFNPYVLEVLILPTAFVIGTGSALVTKKFIVGPIIHVIITVLFYLISLVFMKRIIIIIGLILNGYLLT